MVARPKTEPRLCEVLLRGPIARSSRRSVGIGVGLGCGLLELLGSLALHTRFLSMSPSFELCLARGPGAVACLRALFVSSLSLLLQPFLSSPSCSSHGNQDHENDGCNYQNDDEPIRHENLLSCDYVTSV